MDVLKLLLWFSEAKMFLATAQPLIGVYSDKNVPTAVEQMPICQLFSGLLPGGLILLSQCCTPCAANICIRNLSQSECCVTVL